MRKLTFYTKDRHFQNMIGRGLDKPFVYDCQSPANWKQSD